MAASLSVTIDDAAARERLAQLGARARELAPVMKQWGELLRFSVEENFRLGGRPPWLLSRRARQQGGQTLVDSGRLRASITYRIFEDAVEAGTNVAYGAAHQFGFVGTQHVPAHVRILKRGAFGRTLTLSSLTRRGKPKKHRIGTAVRVKAHTRQQKIPARPYLAVQDQDRQDMLEALRAYLLERRG